MRRRDPSPNELGGFLRARRAELSPSDVGLPEGGAQRRVPGLRREEVAQLAAISTDDYTRLEQGRIHPSAPVLASLARVLGLTDDQRTYMYELAGAPARSRRRAPQKVKPYLRRVLDQIAAPAIVMTPTHDILQWWAGTHVAVKRRGTRTYHHPVVGAITLDWDAFTSDAEPDQQLIVYTAEPGSRSEQALHQLAAWTTEHRSTPR